MIADWGYLWETELSGEVCGGLGYYNIWKGAIPRSEKSRIPSQGSRPWEKVYKFGNTLETVLGRSGVGDEWHKVGNHEGSRL